MNRGRGRRVGSFPFERVGYIHSRVYSTINLSYTNRPLPKHFGIHSSTSSSSLPITISLTALAPLNAIAIPCPLNPTHNQTPSCPGTCPKIGFPSGVCPTIPVHSLIGVSGESPHISGVKCWLRSADWRYVEISGWIVESSAINSSWVGERWRAPPRMMVL